MQPSRPNLEELSGVSYEFQTECLSFLRGLPLPLDAFEAATMEMTADKKGLGWRGLVSLMGKEGASSTLVDVRYAWSEAIFRQNLVDFGCDRLARLFPKARGKQKCRLIILYLCEPARGLLELQKSFSVPAGLLVGNRWREVLHFYLPLPPDHPFRTPRFQGLPPTAEKEPPSMQPGCTTPVFFLPPHPQRQGEGGRRTQGCDQMEGTPRPRVSIITVVFNGAHYLEQAIQSVISQTYPSIEYVVIDGGSSDGSLEILKKYDAFIDYWVSEPDQGIYNAMNKGWRLSRGDYVGFLGCDDVLAELPAGELQQAFSSGLDFVYGDVLLSNGRLFRSGYGAGLRLNNTIPHQGQFVRRTISEAGPFDERFRHFADFDLNQRFFLEKRTAIHASRPVALFRLSGAGGGAGPNEFFQVVRKNFGVAGAVLSYLYLKLRGLAFRLRGWQS